MTIEIELPFGFTTRKYQDRILNALETGKKRAIWVVHRRAGKDLTVWNHCIQAAMERKQIIYYFLPTYSQAKRVIWNGMTKEGRTFLDYIPKQLIERKSESELSILFKNGSLLQLIGAESYDRIVGTSPSLVVFSEAALMPKEAWDFVRPILAENNGTAIFISTPRGMNWFFDLYTYAKTDERNWFCERLTIEDTHAISTDDIDNERKSGMSEDLIQQEFYVSFNRGIEGAYYCKYIDQMRFDRRICAVPYDPTARVNTAWDLGIGDSTAIIFYQLIGNEIHIIDSYEAHGEGLSHYANILDKRGYLYDKHFAPHDIANRELGSGLSRKSVAQTLGINFITLPTLKMQLEDGIEMARGTFPRLWIDEGKNKKLLKALESYRKEFDAKYNVYRDHPVHDEHSHYADAYRYLAIAVRNFSPSTQMDVETYRSWKAEQGWR